MIHKIWRNNADVEQFITGVKRAMLDSINVPMPEINNKLIEYINAPGKYLRSGLVFMVAKGLNIKIDRGLINAAAAVELFHLATLIHDDVIDNADIRRGIKAMHMQFDNRMAIYTGDYALLVAGRLMGQSGIRDEKVVFDDRLLEHVLAGELRQLMNQNNREMSLVDYLRQIRGKTATLFGLATMISGVKAELSRTEVKRLFYAGQMIGMAFQLRDDLIDYRQDEQISGKPQLQDLQNGIYTAPYLVLKQKIANINELNIEELLFMMKKHHVYQEVEGLSEAYLKKSWQYFEMLKIDYQDIKNLFKTMKY